MMMYLVVLGMGVLVMGMGIIAHMGQEMRDASWMNRELELELHTELRAGKTSCKR